jgi:hypothetical protein
MTKQTITIPPCPSWCVIEAGHDWIGVAPDGAHVRYHQAQPDSGESVAGVYAEESEREGVISLAAPHITLYLDEGEHLTYDQTIKITLDLLAAARKLLQTDTEQQVSAAPARPTTQERQAAARVLLAAPIEDRFELINWLQNMLWPVPDVDL